MRKYRIVLSRIPYLITIKNNFMNLKRLARRALATLALSMLCVVALAQTRQITGTVIDGTGESVIGANVLEVGTANGVITDIDGNFTMQVQPHAKIQISFIGYITQTITVGNQTNIKVTLADDSQALDEVVVIGYQTVKRRDLTGSVASVNGKNIAATPVSNVAQALQGKLPGVNVTSQDGRPDAEISIRVRGGGSISQSNDPLVLIDGVAGTLSDIPADQVESIDVLKDASSTAIYGARGANGVILVTTKGAKEGKVTISYNGYAKFNTPTKYVEALDPYDYLAYTWANAAANGKSYVDPFVKLYGLENGGIEQYRGMKSDDIQRDVYNSSFSHSHDLTVTGGTDMTKVLFSVNYMDEQGMKINSYSKRANVSLKVNQMIRKNLDLGLDLRYTDAESMSEEGTTSGSGSILSSAYRFRPIATNHIKGDTDAFREGNMEHYGKYSQWDIYSPYARTMDNEPLKQRQVLRSTASLNWGIIKGLTYHTDLSLSRTWKQDKIWKGAVAVRVPYIDDATGERTASGDAEFRKQDSWGMRWTNTLSYDFNINKDQRLNVLLGHEVSDSGGSDLRVQAQKFPVNFTKDNAFAMINQYDKTRSENAVPVSSSISTPTRILSFFGRLNYNLLERYLLTVTFRADGSSKFVADNRWGYFPAAALAWRISEEPFMQNTKSWLDNLKLRLSYGTVGNDGISADLWSQTWYSESDSRWFYALDGKQQPSYDLSSSTSTPMANPKLKWETTITRNLGLDFGFLDNRISGSVDVYWNTTKDLLMSTPLPGITGFTTTYDNVGQTSNRGVELSLSGVIFQNKDWNISAGFNINFNKNKVDELAEGITGIYGTAWISQSNPSNDYLLKEGSAVGLVRGLVYDGFYTTDDFTYANGVWTLKPGIADVSSSIIPTFHGVGENERPKGQVAYPGMAKFKNLNNEGNSKDVIDTDDYTIIGDMNPVHTGGFNINATYKNFDLGMYFNWSYGNEIYNVNKLASLYGYKESGVYENKLAIVKNAYKMYDIVNGELERLDTPAKLDAANVNASLPLCYNEQGVVSTLGIEDGSYLRLNTMTLGYTLPKQWLNKAGIGNLRVYGTVYNLFTITGYSGLDPEVSANANLNHAVYPTPGLDWGTYPRARSFVVGVNLSF